MSRKDFLVEHGSKAYSELHIKMRMLIPKPLFCVRCSSKPPVDMSNNSGNYLDDINDWEWLCKKCHVNKDRPSLEEKGIKKIFQERNLSLSYFELFVAAGWNNTNIARTLSYEFRERTGLPINIAARTIKRYRKLI